MEQLFKNVIDMQKKAQCLCNFQPTLKKRLKPTNYSVKHYKNHKQQSRAAHTNIKIFLTCCYRFLRCPSQPSTVYNVTAAACLGNIRRHRRCCCCRHRRRRRRDAKSMMGRRARVLYHQRRQSKPNHRGLFLFYACVCVYVGVPGGGG